ncbi:hypothetical protein IE53DRAFT_120351 [Violaceomyces palustris]|uniref:Uncharacterized protein n=1 Tax=Violaceomyces palustris TaxID=1673888 RepID=A0ACD0NVS7_9BASI|nr:hypothetical protein IE53DRAFT_120351 [Violaceomyces palustris]
MGIGSAILGSLGLPGLRSQGGQDASHENQTPALALVSLWKRSPDLVLTKQHLRSFRVLASTDNVRALLWVWLIVASIILIAYWSNPPDSTFRPFLTDLTFRERLRLLHETSISELLSNGEKSLVEADDLAKGTRSPSSTSTLLHRNLYRSSPFALAFSGRLSLSVRTPPYTRKDFGLFSVVSVMHHMPQPFVSVCQCAARKRGLSDEEKVSQLEADTVSNGSIRISRGANQKADPYECNSIFIGAFGRWWVGAYASAVEPTECSSKGIRSKDQNSNQIELEDRGQRLPEWGILDMHTSDSDGFQTPSPPLSDHGKENVEFPSFGNNRAEDRLHVEAFEGGNDGPSSHSQPLADESGRTSSPTGSDRQCSSKLACETPAFLALAATFAASQEIATDLQDQLKSIYSASEVTCQQLQISLDELRARKRAEDKLRADTRTRTKMLDESKRQAESSKREAERRLKAALGFRSSKHACIENMRKEMDELRQRIGMHGKRARDSGVGRRHKVEELGLKVQTTKRSIAELESELPTLRDGISAAEERISLERKKYQAALDLGVWREMDGMDATAYHPNSTPTSIYPLLSGARDRTLENDRTDGIEIQNAPSASLSHVFLPSNLLKTADEESDALPGNIPYRRDVVSNEAATPTQYQPTDYQAPSDFETMRQAFQTIEPTEDEGRRSWSAFDSWQSSVRNNHLKSYLAVERTNMSVESLPHSHGSSPLLPLERCSSAGEAAEPKGYGGDMPQSTNLNKVKRAFRWPFRPFPTSESSEHS